MKDKIFNIFKRYVLYWANKIYPNIRKRIYSLEYYFDNFYLILNDVCKWKSLQLINKNTNKYHYKTIYNEFNKWSNDNVFTDAFKMFVYDNYFKLSKLRKHKKLTLFIDVVKMNNLYGHEYVYINNEYKKKNVTPITIISDHNGLPLAYRHLDYSKKFNKRKSHVHEINNVQKTLNEIKLKCPNYIDISLTGDKAYISNVTYNALSQKIKLIAPKRKNQKTKNTIKEKNLLKKRYKIEHLNAKIKNNNRINLRKERKFQNYSSFLCLSFLQLYFDHINKTNNNEFLEYIERKYNI